MKHVLLTSLEHTFCLQISVLLDSSESRGSLRDRRARGARRGGRAARAGRRGRGRSRGDAGRSPGRGGARGGAAAVPSGSLETSGLGVLLLPTVVVGADEGL